MSETKTHLRDTLESYYRSCGWKVEHAEDGTVRASGIGGVTWIGLPVVAQDLAAEGFEDGLVELAEQRMPKAHSARSSCCRPRIAPTLFGPCSPGFA